MGATDDSLVAGMAAGDAQAATEFVRRYQARVFGLVMRVVGVPAVAEEVAQEAFVRAWRFAGAYDPRRGGVASWLLAIARNAAIDAVRLVRDQPYDPTVLLTMLARTDAGPTSADPERVADVERLRDALAHLPAEQVVAVTLAAVYGLSAREIAEREGIPLGTAKTRIRLGLHRLRDLLEVSDERGG
ncbi:MAG TPA: sigma-70 family RNA polymerase sigma factor [Micromonosporaceae bacterium]